MNDERWDVPSEKLKRMAEGKLTPSMEPCPKCPHHAHLGPCGIEKSAYAGTMCKCKGGKL